MQFFPILQGLERICLNICYYLSFYNITILSNLLKTRKKSPTPPLHGWGIFFRVFRAIRAKKNDK